ncbi:hypothetical protein TIFTF001_014480 [Ficus carica]|uniref:Uncharacterized protein n=1 Tax=Ficus carica TaxID=3494 RepID=A0AA88D876_FICCA|nr:hypothetical protein TIFTF001_014480 [Ficus carica]
MGAEGEQGNKAKENPRPNAMTESQFLSWKRQKGIVCKVMYYNIVLGFAYVGIVTKSEACNHNLVTIWQLKVVMKTGCEANLVPASCVACFGERSLFSSSKG